MRLTAFTDYTIRTLIYLALRPRKHATIADIAAAYGISVNHLMKIACDLREAGDVETLRGQHGGLRLARAPEAINLGAVVRRTEPDMQIVPCFAGGAGCRIHAGCELSHVLAEATAAFLAVLDRHTLAHLLAGHHQALGRLLGVVPIAGHPVAGNPVAGSPVAGHPVAGNPVAGRPVAGYPVAGYPVAVALPSATEMAWDSVWPSGSSPEP